MEKTSRLKRDAELGPACCNPHYLILCIASGAHASYRECLVS